MTATRLPRGMRNNNPLNIEYNSANKWVGQVGSDGRFARFVSLAHGYRAALVILRNYEKRYNLSTMRQLIARWAPPVENRTDRYIVAVETLSGLPADTPLDLYDEATAVKLLRAMSVVECGGVLDDYSAAPIHQAYMMLK